MIAFKTLVFTFFVPGSVTILFPYCITQSVSLPFRLDLGWIRFLGLIPLAAGFVGYVWCAKNFVKRGRGTPAPWDAPRHLVVTGL